MKKLLFIGAALALLGGGCAPAAAPKQAAPQGQENPVPTAKQPGAAKVVAPKPVIVSVEINDAAFAPKQVAVNVGDTVAWTNKGKQNHTVTGIDVSLVWDSGNLKPGATFKRTFDQPGIYKYHDAIYPKLTGEVYVGEVVPQIP